MVTSAAPSAGILATTDEVMGGAGLRHRQVSVVNHSLGRDLSHDFLAAGYNREATTTMIYRGAPAQRPVHKVQAVSLDVLRPALVRDWRVSLPNSSEEVFAQLADRTHLYANGAGVTRLVVFESSEIAARVDAGCQLSFLGADLDDWPREWYGRLGYVEAHRTYDFTSVARRPRETAVSAPRP